jgi:hypothetical protein
MFALRPTTKLVWRIVDIPRTLVVEILQDTTQVLREFRIQPLGLVVDRQDLENTLREVLSVTPNEEPVTLCRFGGRQL